MWKTYVYIVALLSLIAISSSVYGNSFVIGAMIRQIYLHPTSRHVYVEIDVEPINKPACATNAVYDYAFQQNNGIAGGGVLAVLLSAKLTGDNLTIVGTGTCTIYPNMEDINNVILGSSL